MDLMTKRINLSVRFAIVCGMLTILTISMIMMFAYTEVRAVENNDASIIATNPTSEPIVETTVDEEAINSEYTHPTIETTINEATSPKYDEPIVENINNIQTVKPEETTEPENTEPAQTIEPEETIPENAESIDNSTEESTNPTVSDYIGIIDDTVSNIVESIIPKPSEEKVLTYKYGRRMTPAVDINIPTGDDMKNFTGEVDTSNYTYLGKYTVTGYTPKCVHCCGNDKGITASGVEAINGYTVAAGSNLPFGTTLYIEGYGYYVVEDRGGFTGNLIDIACPSHDICYDTTGYGVRVYIVPHEN